MYPYRLARNPLYSYRATLNRSTLVIPKVPVVNPPSFKKTDEVIEKASVAMR